MHSAIKQDFIPGDVVPYAGVYRVHHQNRHVREHEVACVAGTRFPPCKTCGTQVQFLLACGAEPIEASAHFA